MKFPLPSFSFLFGASNAPTTQDAHPNRSSTRSSKGLFRVDAEVFEPVVHRDAPAPPPARRLKDFRASVLQPVGNTLSNPIWITLPRSRDSLSLGVPGDRVSTISRSVTPLSRLVSSKLCLLIPNSVSDD
jgi:hypothetical protein